MANKEQCHIVLRDVSRAFDKVWHNGLKYKIKNIQLPEIIVKLLSSFLDNRTASIFINNHKGKEFIIRSGVPQGSALSPTLYALYTHDIPKPSARNTYILYADDITQIITYQGKGRAMMATKTASEILKVNKYEKKKWKIKTNTNKLKIIPLATNKNHPVKIDNVTIPYSNKGCILGLHFNTQGIRNHIKHQKIKANIALNNIKRFKGLPTNIKIHLVKTCILPILNYPSYPLNSQSKTTLKILQKIQNKSLRFAYNEKYPYERNTEELHTLAKLKPLNVTIQKRGNNIKEKLIKELKDKNYKEIIQTIENTDGSESQYYK